MLELLLDPMPQAGLMAVGIAADDASTIYAIKARGVQGETNKRISAAYASGWRPLARVMGKDAALAGALFAGMYGLDSLGDDTGLYTLHAMFALSMFGFKGIAAASNTLYASGHGRVARVVGFPLEVCLRALNTVTHQYDFS